MVTADQVAEAEYHLAAVKRTLQKAEDEGNPYLPEDMPDIERAIARWEEIIESAKTEPVGEDKS